MKSRRSRLSQLRTILGIALAGLSMAGAMAGPQDGQVIAGSGEIATQGATTTITAGNNAVFRWSGFDIGTNETVRFVQPGTDARVLNFIGNTAPTHIDGSLFANGQVYLMNSAGIYFGGNAVVDVGGLYAVGGSMTKEDFLAGLNRFSGLTGEVRNDGAINGSLVALVGKTVTNTGSIVAPGGFVGLVSGDQVFLRNEGSRILVDAGAAADSTTVATSSATGAGVTNHGAVNAAGGTVVLAAGDLYAVAITHDGSLSGRDVRVQGQGKGDVLISGAIAASQKSAGQKGGAIEITGDRVGILSGAVLDASGATDGGTILVGGDYQGKNPDVRNASATVVQSGALLRSDAIDAGKGGKVVVWSDGQTSFRGTISAQGGAQAGDGGDIEVSGKHVLEFAGLVDTRAPQGQGGHLLLDPDDITLIHATGSTSDTLVGSNPPLFTSTAAGNISDFTIQAQLDLATNVTITTSTGSIISTALFDVDLKGQSLNLNSAAGITLLGTFRGAGTLNLHFATTLDLSTAPTFINSPSVVASGTALGAEVKGPSSGAAFLISGPKAGSIAGVTFSSVDKLTGGAGTNTFTLNSGVSTFNGTIVGGAGTNTLVATDGTNTWAATGSNVGTLNSTTFFTGVANLTGGSGTDTFTGPAAGAAWTINGANSVTVSGLTGTGMEALVGGTGADTFTLAAGVTSFAGSITGGGGTDTLAATNGTNAWALSGANTGTLNSTTSFSGITNLTGGSGADTFTLGSGVTSFGGAIAGGSGSNTLAATDGTNTWTVTGANAGTLNTTTTFSGVGNLTGGSGADTFNVSAGSSIGGVDGGTGGNTLAVASGATTVGGASNLDSLTVTGAGSATFSGAVSSAAVDVSAVTGGSVAFSGGLTATTLTGAANAYSLSITNGSIGSLTGDQFKNTGGLILTTVTVTNGITGAPTATLSGTIGSTNTPLTFGAITLAGSTTLQTSGGALTIGTVTGAANALTLSSLAGAIAGTTMTNVGSLTLLGSGTNVFSGTIGVTGAVTFSLSGGTTTFNSALNAGSLTAQSGAYNLSQTSGAITGAATYNNTGTLTLSGGPTFGSVTATSPSMTTLSGTITGTSGLSFGAVTLGAATTLATTNSAVGLGALDGASHNLSISSGTGGITGSSTVANVPTLTLTNSGTNNFAGLVSATNTSLQLSGGTTSFNGGLTTTLTTAVGNYNLSQTGGTISGATTYRNVGTLTLKGSIGFDTSLTLSGPTALTLGGSVQVSGANQPINFNVPITLSADSSLQTSNGAITLGAVTGASHNLTLSSGTSGVTGTSMAGVGTLSLSDSASNTFSGAISASSVVLDGVTAGTTSFNGGLNTSALTMLANPFNLVQVGGTLTNATPISYLNTGTLSLSGVTLNGGATATSQSAITLSGAVNSAGGALTFGAAGLASGVATSISTSGGNLSLGAVNGVAGGTAETLTLNSGSGTITLAAVSGAGGAADATGLTTLTISNAGAVAFNGAINLSGNVALTNSGAVATTGNTIATPQLTLAGGGAVGTALNPLVTSSPILVLNKTGGASFVSSTGALDVHGSTGGNLTATTSGNITQSAALSVSGTTNLDAQSHSIILDTFAANDFGGAVSLNTISVGNNIAIKTTNALTLGTVTTAGTLTTTSGTLSGSAAVQSTGTATFNSTGNINLTSTSNAFNGSVVFGVGAGASVTLFDSTSIDLTPLTVAALSIGSGGNITQSGGGLSVTGLASFTTQNNSGANITLNAANTFGSVSVRTLNAAGTANAAGVIGLTETGGTNLAGVRTASSFTLSTTNSPLTQSGAISVGGTATFNVGPNSVLLTDSTNDFGTVVVSNSGANNVSIRDANAITLGTSTVGTGTFTVQAGSGIAQAGAVTQGTAAGAVQLIGGTGAVTLGANNHFTGTIAVSNSGGAAVSIKNNTTTTLATSTVGGDLTIDSTAGAIGQTNGSIITVPGTLRLIAGSNDATLDQANDFTRVVVTSGRDISLKDAEGFSFGDGSGTTTGLSTITGKLTLTGSSGGTFTQVTTGVSSNSDGRLLVAGLTDLAGGSNAIDLTNTANHFTGAVTVTTTGGANAAIADGSALTLAAVNTPGGSFSATAGTALVLNGDVNATTVTLGSSGAMTQANGKRVTATTLNLNGTGTVGSSGAHFFSTVDTINFNKGVGTGDVYLEELDAVTLAGTTQGVVDITLTTAGHIITQSSLTAVGGFVPHNATVSYSGTIGGNPLLSGNVILGGDTTFTGNITLNGNATFNTSAGQTLTFNGTINGGFALTMNIASGGTTVLANNVIGLTSFTSTGLGLLQISSNLSAGAGGINFGSAVQLAGNSILTTTGSGAVTFNSTVDSDSTARSLTVNSSGTTTFNGAVGGTSALAALTTDVGGTVVINGGSVVTTGAQTYNDAATLAADTTLTTTNANVTLAAGVSSANATRRDLTINNGSGTTTLGASGAVGKELGVVSLNGTGNIRLAGLRATSLTTAAPAPVSLNGNMTTTGSQIYGGFVSLDSATAISAASTQYNGGLGGTGTLTLVGDATFSGTTNLGGLVVTGTTLLSGTLTTLNEQTYTGLVTLAGNATLTGSTIKFSSGLTGSRALVINGNLDLSAVSGTTNLDSLSVSGTTLLNGSISTGGNQTYGGAVSLNGDTNLTGSTVMFSGGVGGTGGLTITGNADISGGSSTSLGSLLVSGTTAFGGNVTTAGIQTYTGAVTLRSASALTGSKITFGSSVNGSGDLTIKGDAVFSGAGGNATLGALSISGTTALNGSITTNGAQLYTGAVTLGSSTTLTASNADVKMIAGVEGSGRSLTINNGSGATTLGSAGITAALGEVKLNGTGATTLGTVNATLLTTGGATTLNGSVATSGVQTYGGNVTMAGSDGDRVFNGSTITFNGTLNGTRGVTIRGDALFGGVVGGAGPLSFLSVSGATVLNASSVRTSGAQNYGGLVTLGGNAALTGNNVTFGGAVNGASALVITGNANFAGGVGTTTALNSLSVTGTAALNGSVITTGAQTYGGAVTLTVDGVAPTNSGNGGIAVADVAGSVLNFTGTTIGFNGTLDGNRAVAINGNARFGDGAGDFVGNVSALSSLTVSGTTAVNGGGIKTIGVQSYASAVTLGASATFSGSSLTFNSTVDSTGTTGAALTANAAGTTLFNGALGGSGRLGALTTDAGGNTIIRGNIAAASANFADSVSFEGPSALAVDTTGNQVFAQALQLGTSLTLNASGGSLTLAQGASGAGRALTLQASTTSAQGFVRVGGDLGSSTARLQSLSANAHDVTVKNIFATDDITIAIATDQGTVTGGVNAALQITGDTLDSQNGAIVLGSGAFGGGATKTGASLRASIFASNGDLTLVGKTVVIEPYERLAVRNGNLIIFADDSITLSSTSASGAIALISPLIQIRSRAPQPVATGSGTASLDLGTDLVAAKVLFYRGNSAGAPARSELPTFASTLPTAQGNLLANSPETIRILGGNSVVFIADLAVQRSIFRPVVPGMTYLDLATVPGLAGLSTIPSDRFGDANDNPVLSVVAGGQVRGSVSQAYVPSVPKENQPVAPAEADLEPAVREQLAALGIYARALVASEQAARDRRAGLFVVVPDRAHPLDEDYKVVDARVEEGSVREVLRLAAESKLIGDGTRGLGEVADALAATYETFVAETGGEDAGRYRKWLESHTERNTALVLNFTRSVNAMFHQVSLLGLTRKEIDVSKAYIYGSILLPRLNADVEFLRTLIEDAPRGGRLAQDNLTPANSVSPTTQKIPEVKPSSSGSLLSRTWHGLGSSIMGVWRNPFTKKP